MTKFSMFNKLENFNKFTKLSKNFGELDDKLIIQHFHHIDICNLTSPCILQILAHSKIHNTYIFHSYKYLECSLKRSCKSPKRK